MCPLFMEVTLQIGHIGTLKTVLFAQVVLNSEVIYSGTNTLGPWKLVLDRE